MHSINPHHTQPPQLQQYLYQTGVASQLHNMNPLGAAPPGPYGPPGVGDLMDAAVGPAPGVSSKMAAQAAQAQQYMDEEKVYQLILDLTNPQTREQALLELSKKREAYEDLAP